MVAGGTIGLPLWKVPVTVGICRLGGKEVG